MTTSFVCGISCAAASFSEGRWRQQDISFLFDVYKVKQLHILIVFFDLSKRCSENLTLPLLFQSVSQSKNLTDSSGSEAVQTQKLVQVHSFFSLEGDMRLTKQSFRGWHASVTLIERSRFEYQNKKYIYLRAKK